MARLPDPTDKLKGADLELFEHMASVRSHADGRPQLGSVYVYMFNNPGVTAKVSALGEYLRFHATLPDDVRELAILRFSVDQGFEYEWAHHQRPAALAGLDEDVLAAVTAGAPSNDPALEGLRSEQRATLDAIDAVCGGRSIPGDVQDVLVEAFGEGGPVELVALCGLYSTMGYMTTAFDIAVEDGFPRWER
ncbi:MAG: carboxymuconolactone decarboxylase family protein [Microthrixaceae bacterium]